MNYERLQLFFVNSTSVLSHHSLQNINKYTRGLEHFKHLVNHVLIKVSSRKFKTFPESMGRDAHLYTLIRI